MTEKTVSNLILDELARKLESDELLKPISSEVISLFAQKYTDADISRLLLIKEENENPSP